MLGFTMMLFIFILSISFIYLIYMGVRFLLEKNHPLEDAALLGP